MDRRRQVGVALVVAALLLFAAPFALWPHYGETPHSLYVTEADDPDGPVTAYENLQPDAQSVFDAQFTNESGVMYSESDSALVSTFRSTDYVEYEGQVYRVAVEHADGAWMFVTPIRWLMFGLGALFGFAGLGLLLGKPPDIELPS